MPLTVNDFQRVADSAFFTSRDIEIGKDTSGAKLGNYFISAGKEKNNAVMKAFKEALQNEYGSLGVHAFDTIVGRRNDLNKSLRACDVKKTVSNLMFLKGNRFISELNRQLDTHPKMLSLSEDMQNLVRKELHKCPVADTRKEAVNVLKSIRTDEEMSSAVSARLDRSIDELIDHIRNEKLLGKETEEELRGKFRALGENHKTEKAVGEREATGLKNLNVIFESGQTSVADKVKKGLLGKSMRVNRSTTNPVLFSQLKSNGVEPGFIYTNDWSANDTKGLFTDYTSEESLAELEKLKEADPKFAAACEGKSVRDQIMLAGRAHPAVMSAIADYVVEKGMEDENSAIYKAFEKYFPKLDPENWQTAGSDNINSKLFAEIRDAILSVRPMLPNGEENPEYKLSPAFKHFADNHILKLDYNESDRVRAHDAAHEGSFMRPERILASRKPLLGQIYRLQTAASADKISSGAVTEALANDLTRVAGVPSQELQIVRGKYSDGHPKLMLQAKFATGYQDMENGFIKDGRVVSPDGKPLESLGKYKPFFLLTADRDAVGRRGQNKGFANGKFFAIDPGHSLEGNGKYLDIQDDFSFKDTYGSSTKPRFENFSVFDDDTRFAKLKGLVELRELHKSGAFQKVFDDYRKAFDPKAKGISKDEVALREQINRDIDKKQAEFSHQMTRLLKVFDNQLALFDDLAADGARMQEGAVETIANLEKLCSVTTWVSKNREVPLKHLEVEQQTRVPWYASVDETKNNIVYYCDAQIPERASEFIRDVAERFGAQFSTDAQGATRLVVPKDKAEALFAALSEENVANFTHPAEAEARRNGGTGVAEVANYVPLPPSPPADLRPPLKAAQLPNELELTIDNGSKVKFPKVHYEALVENEPAATRPRTVEDLKAFLEARIARGREIIAALLSGRTHCFPPTLKNITAFTIAIHAAALKKGEMMYRGSFSISDPDGNIARWLDSARGIYQRTSTHAKPFQSMMVDGHLNMPRGYDVAAPGKYGLLNGMRTFHYFSLPDVKYLETAQGCGKNRRLFLKCETYGVFVNTIHLKTAAKKGSRTDQMEPRGYEFGDVSESILHGTSLFKSKFTSKNAPGIRKEDLTDAMKTQIETAKKALKKAGMANLANMLVSDDVLKGGGINMLLKNIEDVAMNLPQDDERMGKAVEILDNLLVNVEELANEKSGDANIRLGNEIMIDPKDFQ